jgi:hypothetical protein
MRIHSNSLKVIIVIIRKWVLLLELDILIMFNRNQIIMKVSLIKELKMIKRIKIIKIMMYIMIMI